MVQESTKKVEYADSLVWVGQFSSQGFNQVVEQRDVPELRSAEEIKVLTERALELWKRHGRVGKVYWLMHWKFILLGLGICIVHGTLSSFVGILCLWGFVGELAKSQDEVSLSLVGWGTGIVVCVTMNTLLYGYQRQILGGRLATDFVSWGTGLILWKSTRVTQSDENDTDEATLVGADLSRIAEDMLLLGNMASNILQLIGCVSIAFYFTGLVSSLVVVGLLVVAIVAFSFLSAKVHDVEMKSLAVMDYRVNLLRHFVQNLFAVKQSCWEELFLDAIFKARKEESRLIYWFRVFGVSARNMGDVCVVMSASLAIFIMLLGESDIITVQQVFAVSAALWYLRGPFYEIPQQAIKVANILVSVRRFERYLSLDEIDTLPTPENHQDGLLMAAQNAIFSWNRPEPHGALEPIHVEPQEHSVQSVALEMAPTTAQHQEEDIEDERDKHQQHQDDDDKKLASKTFVLDKIDIKVTKGSLVGIVGGLGSGKTALLEAVTGTLCRLSGYVAITDSIGYVSQPPLLFSGTVKENILSGRPLDEDFLRRVVVASGLEPDLQGMAGGLNTYVGDQGRTLSGGQQVRVAFARALYGKPSLLLLDDPLRALDATVASHVFHRGVLCFLGRCNCSSDATLDQSCIRERDGPCSRGVLLALNQGQLIRHFDQIIVLHEGAQVEAGSGEFVLRREGFLAKNNIITTMRDAETNSKTRTAAPAEKETQPPNEQLKENDIVVDSLDEELKEEQGASSFDAFVRYVKEMGIGVFLISLLLGMAGFGATVSGDVSLAFFMTSIDENQVNFSYAYAFLALTLFGGLMIEVVSIYNTSLTQRASSGVHRKALLKIARAPLAWFERNPSGRLLARFSGDLLAVDRLLSDQYDIVFHIVFFLIATIGMIGYIVPELVVVIAVVIISFFLIVLYLDKTDAQVRRIAMQALGPVVGDMAVVASHRSSIRVMQLEQYAEDQTFQHLSEYLSSMYSTNSIVNFGTLLGTVMGLVVSVVFVTFFGVRRTQEDSSHAAVALVYSCFILPQWILIILVALPGILNYLKSLERLLQYTRDSIPQEPPQVLETDESLHNWPVNGTMVFENVSLVYRDGDRPALKDVSMTWESGQRIGCVGTTGAGKSSLVSLIFRIREVTSGRIVLGGHDISKIGIQKVRQVVGGIPQTPLVLPGGLRKNLDPFNQFPADKVEQVLRMIRLDTNWAHLEENEGDSQDAGLREKKMLSLSTGQLQLLSLGRLILRKENIKVVVLDEPTSSSEADEILHHVLQDQFPHATTITIAHRLQSVMSCDKIAVLSKGKLVEFDSPSHLASHPASMFATLLSQYK